MNEAIRAKATEDFEAFKEAVLTHADNAPIEMAIEHAEDAIERDEDLTALGFGVECCVGRRAYTRGRGCSPSAQFYANALLSKFIDWLASEGAFLQALSKFWFGTGNSVDVPLRNEPDLTALRELMGECPSQYADLAYSLGMNPEAELPDEPSGMDAGADAPSDDDTPTPTDEATEGGDQTALGTPEENAVVGEEDAQEGESNEEPTPKA